MRPGGRFAAVVLALLPLYALIYTPHHDLEKPDTGYSPILPDTVVPEIPRQHPVCLKWQDTPLEAELQTFLKSQNCEQLDSNTTVRLVGIQDKQSLSPGKHQFLLGAAGGGCVGGDYYEIRLESHEVKVPVRHRDLCNGWHLVSFQVAEPGVYQLQILLAWHGPGPETTLIPTTRKLVNHFVASLSLIVPLNETNKQANYSHCPDWSVQAAAGGRWIQLARNQHCHPPFCTGNIGMVSRDRWVYSPWSCYYHIFSRSEAWHCLAGRSLAFTGDSTTQEDYLELIKQVLGKDEGDKVNGPTWKRFRNYDRVITNPQNHSQQVRVIMVWNGHPEHYGLHRGLATYEDAGHKERLQHLFHPVKHEDNIASRPPDLMVANSGMHDIFFYNQSTGVYDTFTNFSRRLAVALGVLRGAAGPRALVWRATKAPAGPRYRDWNPNPHKYLQGPLIIDQITTVAREAIEAAGVSYIDTWDLTYPLHWDTTYSDGHHYSATKNKMGEHMYLQMLLNGICTPPDQPG